MLSSNDLFLLGFVLKPSIPSGAPAPVLRVLQFFSSSLLVLLLKLANPLRAVWSSSSLFVASTLVVRFDRCAQISQTLGSCSSVFAPHRQEPQPGRIGV